MKWISFFLAMSALFLNTAFGVYNTNLTQKYSSSSELHEVQSLTPNPEAGASNFEMGASRSEVIVFQSETLEILGIMAQEQVDSSLRSEYMCLEPHFCWDLDCDNPGAMTIAYHKNGFEFTGVTYLD